VLFRSFPLSCTSIGSAAFSLCTGLTGELNFPSTISKISYNAFVNCTALTGDLIIPPLVTHLESGVFYQCSSITSLTIPPSVRIIEPGAFEGCSGLQVIEAQPLTPVPLTINQKVFEGVDYNTCILKVPYQTKERYASANAWEEFTNIIEQESGFLLGATSLRFNKEQSVNSSIRLTANVDWKAGSDQEWLSVRPASGNNDQTITVTVEANPTVSAREGTLLFTSDGLYSQSIKVTQDAITKAINIASGGLSKALSEEEKQRISSLTLTGRMDARDFKTLRFEMPLLEVLDISGATIEAYTDTTFGNQILHPANAIPAAIYEWNDSPQTSYALSEHPKLAVIKLPHSLKTIGYRAFYSCRLRTVEMQSSVERIGTEAFMVCSGLTDINLPSSLTSISNAAFKWCISLPSIELPSSLKQIEYETFAGCSALESIVIPSSITSIQDNAFKGCSSLESVMIPFSVTIISRETFMDCSSLISVVIPSMVTRIEEFAFRGCSDLMSLSLPESLTAIEPAAFSDCINLDTIYSYAVNPPDLDNPGGWDVIDKVDKTSCLLYVPKGTKEVYARAFGWKEFTHIVEMTQLKVSKKEVTLEAAQGSSNSITISGTAKWAARWKEPWLKVDPATGTGEKAIFLTALETNHADRARMATVTISAPGAGPQIVFVTQKTIPVGVDEMAQSRPAFNCYPNPFTEVVTIEIQNPQQEKITVDIYNLAGQRVKNLASRNIAGQLNLKWDGTNEQGQKVPVGIYLCKMNKQYKKLIFRGQ